MSNLWDLGHLQPALGIALEGETVPEMFWNGVKRRGDVVFMRQKHLGLWRSWTWTETGQAVREIASICCWPPDSRPASWPARSRRMGK